MSETIVPREAAATRSAYRLRLLVSRLRRQLKQAHGHHDLTPSQISVISRLSHDGPATASDLAVGEGVRRQSIAAVVAVLEERGIVRREPDPDDGRRQLVVLSPDAVHELQGSRRLRDEWLADALVRTYSAEELAVIDEALGLLDRLPGLNIKVDSAGDD